MTLIKGIQLNKDSLSVIVPNYNYAHFLKRRLDSIISQTIKPSEIIFLDDCSTDNSLEIAEKLLKSYGIAYTVITSETNNGVFIQWLRGITLARYDYIWIAEADDSCEPDLLGKLLTQFNDSSVIISYCQSRIINKYNQNSNRMHYNDIANHINANRWLNDYVNNCYDEASKYLSITSTIANASAVILKKSVLPLDKLQQVSKFKMAGDWLFYLLVLFENPTSKIAYCADVLNIWHKHGTNIWADETKEITAYTECLKIYKIILTDYNVPPEAKKHIYGILVKHYLNTYIKDVDYSELLFSVINLLGNASLVLNILHAILQVKLLRISLACLAKFSHGLRLKWLAASGSGNTYK